MERTRMWAAGWVTLTGPGCVQGAGYKSVHTVGFIYVKKKNSLLVGEYRIGVASGRKG